jgi:hypothetical protein
MADANGPPIMPMDPCLRMKRHGPPRQWTPLSKRESPPPPEFFTKWYTKCLFLHSFFGLQWHVMGTQHSCVGAGVRFEACRWCDRKDYVGFCVVLNPLPLAPLCTLLHILRMSWCCRVEVACPVCPARPEARWCGMLPFLLPSGGTVCPAHP